MEFKPSKSVNEYIKDSWFSETEAMWPGQRFSLKVAENGIGDSYVDVDSIKDVSDNIFATIG